MKDLMNYVNPRLALAPQVQTNASGALVGTIIDRQGFESLTFLIALGAVTDANMTFAVSLEHGDDSALADTAAPSVDQVIGTLALAGGDFNSDNVCKKIGYSGNKRYVRLTVTSAGNDAGAFPVAAVAVLGHPTQIPTVNPPA
jgi:hypothetical protein